MACPDRRPPQLRLDIGQQPELFAEVDRVELGKLGPLGDRVVAEAHGLAGQLVEHHKQLPYVSPGADSGTAFDRGARRVRSQAGTRHMDAKSYGNVIPLFAGEPELGR
jgi:hypothetical protein